MELFFGPCWGKCRHDERAAACHAECISLQSTTGRELFEQITSNGVTASRYEPTPSEDLRRTSWLQSHFALAIQNAYPLPAEVCYIIAQYCVLWRAIRFQQPDQWGGNFRVSISTEIWARYTTFEDVEYIASLTNNPGKKGYSVIHVPRSGKVINTIHLAEDHLGVRQLLFSTSEEAPPVKERTGVWWISLLLSTPDANVRGHTDVSPGSTLCDYLAEIGRYF